MLAARASEFGDLQRPRLPGQDDPMDATACPHDPGVAGLRTPARMRFDWSTRLLGRIDAVRMELSGIFPDLSIGVVPARLRVDKTDSRKSSQRRLLVLFLLGRPLIIVVVIAIFAAINVIDLSIFIAQQQKSTPD